MAALPHLDSRRLEYPVALLVFSARVNMALTAHVDCLSKLFQRIIHEWLSHVDIEKLAAWLNHPHWAS